MTDVVNPLHPEIITRLDPEFASYYNAHMATKYGAHQLPWNPAIRKEPPIAGSSEPLKTYDRKDIPLSKCTIRVFLPEPSNAPAEGWPVLLYFHGGGWTLGNINTENHFSAAMCLKANCVVFSVDYRLGPEEPYPAAIEDAVEAMLWVLKHAKSEFNVDVSRFAVGGSSSGANLAAVLTHKAALSVPPIPLTFQLLVVPVVDNTASTSGQPYLSWKENQNTPSLTPARMLWFRDNYLPDAEDRKNWDNSPIFAPDESFKNVPDAWIAVGELDILRDEGIAYGEKLEKSGRKAEIKIYKGSPHPIMAMDGIVLKSGRDLIADAAQALERAFYGKSSE
ncbi:lipase/ esterase [Phellopilus nigrolimitatus]|nr:lipase/ esterase [Phellopilus nigrolimitatus]